MRNADWGVNGQDSAFNGVISLSFYPADGPCGGVADGGVGVVLGAADGGQCAAGEGADAAEEFEGDVASGGVFVAQFPEEAVNCGGGFWSKCFQRDFTMCVDVFVCVVEVLSQHADGDGEEGGTVAGDEDVSD